MLYSVKVGQGDFGDFEVAFRGWSPGKMLEDVGIYWVEADDFQSATEAIWVIGNRMNNDVDGNKWPSNVRSMSVGDVAIIREHRKDGVVKAFAVRGVGWEQFLVTDVMKALHDGDLADFRSVPEPRRAGRYA